MTTKEESLTWWNNRISRHQKKGLIPEDYTKMERRSIQVGSMITFSYNAKGDGKLAFWDKSPCVILFNDFSGYFMGLNVHYIHPMFRKTLLTKVIELNKMKIRNDQRFTLAWEQLNQFIKRNGLELAIRKYIKGRMSSVDYVKGTEWKFVAEMPSEKFVFNGTVPADQLYQMIRSHSTKTKSAKNTRYGR